MGAVSTRGPHAIWRWRLDVLDGVIQRGGSPVRPGPLLIFGLRGRQGGRNRFKRRNLPAGHRPGRARCRQSTPQIFGERRDFAELLSDVIQNAVSGGQGPNVCWRRR
jgi:hypothetical protein